MLSTPIHLCIIFQLLFCASAQNPSEEWWRDSFIYQIYPRSFKDSDGDGIGDLNGITSKLDHLADLNISAMWISPIYVSPMVDFGYDIANFTDVDPIFGTLDDFSKLMAKAKKLGIRVLLDFVPNHSSDKHPWFLKSVQRIKPYDDYYIWKDAKMVNGTRHPPNNWLSLFQGSAWEWNDHRQQYYYHQFAVQQPDLNYRSAAVNEEMVNVLKFWLDSGVDGFRIDTVPTIFEDERFLDEPVIPNTGLPDTDPGTLQHIYTSNLEENYHLLQYWRDLLDTTGGHKKLFLTEAWVDLDRLMKYYHYGSNIPFNFMFLEELHNSSTTSDMKRVIERYLNAIPAGQLPNWVVGSHDKSRVASRFGAKRADWISMIAAVLPGIGIIYNGDEIGMENRPMSYEETVDPAGCNAGPNRYNFTSRDPLRTPFQWDDSTSAGFSTSEKTWLPVHSNYKTLNLALQKQTPVSHYNVLKKLVQLKKHITIKDGSTEIVVVENVLGIIRRLEGRNPIVLLLNFNYSDFMADFSRLGIPEVMTVYAASVYSEIQTGASLDMTLFNIPGSAAVILM